MAAINTSEEDAQFKLVPGYSTYRIDRDGRVQSLRRGRGLGPGVWSDMTPYPSAQGRWQVNLRRDGKMRCVRVHRLVLEAFVGPCPPGMEACHNNGDHLDNRLDNLRWDTRKSNSRDRRIHGTQLLGCLNPSTKLSAANVLSIRELAARGIDRTQIAETFGVSSSNVYTILRGETWSHLPLSDDTNGKHVVTETHTRPRVVCLCGSTRFRNEYARAFYDEEHAGRIVLSVPCYKDDSCCKTVEDHERLDRLHLAKIDMADEVLIINPGDYVGNSTRNEIAYARAKGKTVRFLEASSHAAALDLDGCTSGDLAP